MANPHTGDNIPTILQSVPAEWKIPNKNVGHTTIKEYPDLEVDDTHDINDSTVADMVSLKHENLSLEDIENDKDEIENNNESNVTVSVNPPLHLL